MSASAPNHKRPKGALLTSPCVVIFGAKVMPDGTASGTLARRVASAVAFGKSDPGTLYIVSGGKGAGALPEWQVMQALLENSGVPCYRIVADHESKDTLQQVVCCASIAFAIGMADKVWLATSSYHQPRCWLLFAISGIRVHLVPSLSDRPYLPWRRICWLWLRELVAIPYDIMAMVVRTVRTTARPTSGHSIN